MSRIAKQGIEKAVKVKEERSKDFWFYEERVREAINFLLLYQQSAILKKSLEKIQFKYYEQEVTDMF